MREDLPCEEPLPKWWSINLAPGGDIVDRGPCLEDFVFVESLGLGESRCWRVQERGSGDSVTHVLCETKFILPEKFAVPHLGRLRELMLREARLLDSLSHECIVPLERGWLEQRAGLEQPAICACAFCWSGPLVTTRTIGSEDVDDTTPAEEHATGEDYLRNGSSFQCRDRVEHTTDVLEDGRSNLRQPHLRGATATAPRDSIVCCGGCGQTGNPVRFSVRSGYGFRSEDDAVAFLLRSWVPLTVGDLEVDDDEYDRVEADQDEGGEVVGSNKNIGEGGSRSASQYGGVEQLRWGGDGTTDWRGTAEPKSTADGPNSTTNTPAAEKPFDRKTPDPRVDEGGGNRMAFLYGERIVCLTSYLLLPDWLPLSVWFVTEFEPRTAASDEQDGTATTGVVTAPDDWALVWRHLLSMFVQVVRGVEHLHGHGLIHNNISSSSVWVAADGRCCVGNLSKAAPPGIRRPPSRTAAHARDHHFASPERRRGCRVGAKSDMYSLGVLVLEFWRNYVLSRGLGELWLTGGDGLLERIKSGAPVPAQPEGGGGLLDAILVKSMLAEDPFDRPDCFEVVDSLSGS